MANYLYNGVELPDINEVWPAGEEAAEGSSPLTQEEAYLYAVIISASDGSYHLNFTSAMRQVTTEGELSVSDEGVSFILSEDSASWSDATTCPAGTPIWANYDITSEDGTVYLAASDPVPVSTSTFTLDLKSWLTGFALGLCGKPLPFAKKTPIGYSYNGVVLPALPEWDRETYPYATIIWIFGNTYLYVTDSEPYCRLTDGYLIIPAGMGFVMYKHDTDGDVWTVYDTGPNNFESDWFCSKIWANHDLKYEDGTVYLAASEPVPVYKIVGYSYNGVTLPALPEWDKTVYPYAYLTKSLEDDSIVWLLISTEEKTVNESGVLSSTNANWYKYADGKWGNIDTSMIFVAKVFWVTHDVLTEDGTVYLAASEPTPVYE